VLFRSPRNASESSAARPRGRSVEQGPAAGQRKLSFKERQELDALPAKIEKYDAEIAALHREMAKPQFYQQQGTQIAAEQARLKQLEQQLAAAYDRWEELEQHA